MTHRAFATLAKMGALNAVAANYRVALVLPATTQIQVSLQQPTQPLRALVPEKLLNRAVFEVSRLLRLEVLHDLAVVLSRGGELIQTGDDLVCLAHQGGSPFDTYRCRNFIPTT